MWPDRGGGWEAAVRRLASGRAVIAPIHPLAGEPPKAGGAAQKRAKKKKKKKKKKGCFCCGAAEKNMTRNQGLWIRSLASLSGLRI